ncbi:hypothetical protein [Fusobacterium ulcerans]|uniref:hypothetical protein n=1 Tax=Fusobacterium ulcerans TaxID=861 RepID=UPI002E76AE79|nr:hypothetical protein [Fusobacterium ulcerans]MEE0137698.1 hypothetical protein [Fusobacterium ulcerans]
MKKVLIGVMLLSLLVGCGVKTHSPKEKKELITEVYGFSYRPIDMDAKLKLDKIMEDLEKEAKIGNKKAIKELEEWRKALPLKPVNEGAGTNGGKWD